MRNSVVVCLVVLTNIMSLQAVTPYPIIFGTEDNTYRVEVNGVDVPVANLHWRNQLIGRFSQSQPVEVVVSTEDTRIAGYRILPRRLNITATVEGNSIRFTLPQPENLRIRINGHAPLNLFSYQSFSTSDTSGNAVVNGVSEFGLDPTGNQKVTGSLQEAIDQISSNGGGTLFFPSGKYVGDENSTIYVKSGVRLLLSPGALIKQIRCLINDAADVKIQGHGIWDFTGAPGGNQASYLVCNNSRRVDIRDIISISTDYNWNTRTNHSDSITFSNYKVFSGKDGIDPCDSRNVTVKNVFVMSDDDCIAVKSFSPSASVVENILVEDCFLQCFKYGAVKIGTETNTNAFRNVTFRNVEIIAAERPGILQCRDGAEITDVTFENFVVELGWSRSFDFVIEERAGLGHIRNITVKNVNIWNSAGGRISGFDATHQVENVTFEDLTISGEFVNTRQKTGFDYRHASDITFGSAGKVPQDLPELHSFVSARSDNWNGNSLEALSDRNAATSVSASGEEAMLEFDFGESKLISGALVRSPKGLGGFSLQTWNGSTWTAQFDHLYSYQEDFWYNPTFEPVSTDKIRVYFHTRHGSNELSVSDFVLSRNVEVSNIPLIAGRITEPKDNELLVAGIPTTISAEASAESGVSKVAFFANSQLIGEDADAPYEITWETPSVGSWQIHAKIHNQNMQSDITSPVSVIVAQPMVFSGRIEAEDYAAMEGIDTGPGEDEDGTDFVGWISGGDWMKFLIDVQDEADCDFSYRIAAPGAGGRFSFSVDETIIDTFEVPKTGGYQTWATETGPAIHLSAGVHTLTVKVLQGGWNINYFDLISDMTSALGRNTFPRKRNVRIIRNAGTVVLSGLTGNERVSVLDLSGRIRSQHDLTTNISATTIPILGSAGCLLISIEAQDFRLLRKLPVLQSSVP